MQLERSLCLGLVWTPGFESRKKNFKTLEFLRVLELAPDSVINLYKKILIKVVELIKNVHKNVLRVREQDELVFDKFCRPYLKIRQNINALERLLCPKIAAINQRFKNGPHLTFTNAPACIRHELISATNISQIFYYQDAREKSVLSQD